MSEHYHHGNLRRALLDAGLDLIREAGSRGFTLRELARRSGVSHNAPYRHFRDKEDLVAAIAEEGFDGLEKEMRKARGSQANPAASLVDAGRAYVALALRRPDHFKVMFETDLDRQRHPDARDAADRAFHSLLDLIRDCQEVGELPRGDALDLARMAWSLVHGFASLAIGGQFRGMKRAEVLALTERAMWAVLAGLRKR